VSSFFAGLQFLEAALQNSEAAGADDITNGIAWLGYRRRLAINSRSVRELLRISEEKKEKVGRT
jgi:hypothetical protein